MKNIKKILITIFSSLILISCSALSSEEYFKRGEYLKALERASVEVTNLKSEEERNQLKSRVNNIISVYENNVKNAVGSYSKADSNYNMFRLLNIVEDNALLQQYTNVLGRYNTVDLLNKSIYYTKEYSSQNNTLEPLSKLQNKMSNSNLINGKYSDIYRNYSRYVADRYYDLAYLNEKSGNLEIASQNYKNAYYAFKEFDNNYRDSYNKYIYITKVIELKKAEEFVNKANNDNALGNKREAIRYYSAAIEIYEKYDMYSEVRTYKRILESIKRDEELKDADILYNKGFEEYNYGNFERAKEYFNRALKIYERYDVRDKRSQIKVYLENIDFKINKSKGDRYFEQGKQYYELKQYATAKEYFIKAREIYLAFNNDSKIREINLYLEVINSKLNISDNSGNNGGGYEKKSLFDKYYKLAKDNIKLAEKEIKIEKTNSYYKKAIEYYKEALKYVQDYKIKDEILNDIEYITKNYIIIINDTYNNYYNEGIRYYNMYIKEYEGYNKRYYKEKAIELLEKAYYKTTDEYSKTKIRDLLYELKNGNYITNFNNVYNEALSYIKKAEDAWFSSEKDVFYKKAINKLEEAKKYTNNSNTIYNINQKIKEIEYKIFN